MKNDKVKASDSGNTAQHTQDLDAGKEAVGEAYKKLMEAKAHFSKAAEAAGIEFKDEALERLHKGEKSLEALGSQVATSAKSNPLAALGIAVAAGFLFSKLISRK